MPDPRDLFEVKLCGTSSENKSLLNQTPRQPILIYTHSVKGEGAVCDYMILQRLTMNICKREDLVKRLTFSLPKLPLPPPPIWIGNNKIMFISARTCPLHCAVCTVSVVEDMREVKLRRLL